MSTKRSHYRENTGLVRSKNRKKSPKLFERLPYAEWVADQEARGVKRSQPTKFQRWMKLRKGGVDSPPEVPLGLRLPPLPVSPEASPEVDRSRRTKRQLVFDDDEGDLKMRRLSEVRESYMDVYEPEGRMESLPVDAFFQDMKWVDYFKDPVYFKNNAFFYPQKPFVLNKLYRGANRYERIGTSIFMKSLRVSGYIYPTLLNIVPHTWNPVRLIVVYEKYHSGPVGEHPRFSSIYGSTQHDSLEQYRLYSGLNIAAGAGENYITLLDLRWMLPPIGIDGAQSTTYDNQAFPYGDRQNYFFDHFIDMKGLHAQYSDDVKNIPEHADTPVHGNVFCYLMQKESLTSVDPVHSPYAVDLMCRLRFTERGISGSHK